MQFLYTYATIILVGAMIGLTVSRSQRERALDLIQVTFLLGAAFFFAGWRLWAGLTLTGLMLSLLFALLGVVVLVSGMLLGDKLFRPNDG